MDQSCGMKCSIICCPKQRNTTAEIRIVVRKKQNAVFTAFFCAVILASDNIIRYDVSIGGVPLKRKTVFAAALLLMIFILCITACKQEEKEIKFPEKPSFSSKPVQTETIIPNTPEPTEEPKASPEDIAVLFMDAAKNMDYDAIRALCVTDAEITAEYGTEYELAFKAIFAKSAKELQYEIVNTNINGDQAEVSISCTYADCTPYIREVVKEAVVQAVTKTMRGEITKKEQYLEIAIDVMFAKSNLLGKNLIKTEIVLPLVKDQNEEWLIKEVTKEVKAVITMNFSETVGLLLEYWK